LSWYFNHNAGLPALCCIPLCPCVADAPTPPVLPGPACHPPQHPQAEVSALNFSTSAGDLPSVHMALDNSTWGLVHISVSGLTKAGAYLIAVKHVSPCPRR